MKTFNETKLMLSRSLVHAIRNPIWLFLNLFQPILYLVLFMPLLEG